MPPAHILYNEILTYIVCVLLLMYVSTGYLMFTGKVYTRHKVKQDLTKKGEYYNFIRESAHWRFNLNHVQIWT